MLTKITQVETDFDFKNIIKKGPKVKLVNRQGGTDETDAGVYKMSSDPRGIAMIINNKNFDTLPKRDGTDKDADDLEQLFDKTLGFIVQRHNGLKSADIRQKLEV